MLFTNYGFYIDNANANASTNLEENVINFAENAADTPCFESQNDVNEDLSN